jgi:hypothetical protein
MYQYWKYYWLHLPTGRKGEATTLCEMTPHQFLSALTWWSGGDWFYWADKNQPGILPQHMCRNVRKE